MKKKKTFPRDTGPICIKCPHSEFLDPAKEICYKTGGLHCKVLDIIVGKYDPCHIPGRAEAPGKT